MISRILLRTALVAVCLALTACSNFEGPPAERDELYFPVGLALHPSGDFLYVLNTNFDVRFRSDQGGTVAVIDLEEQRILAETTVRTASFGAQLELAHPDLDGNPQVLLAAVRGDNSVVILDVADGGASISCNGAFDARGCSVSRLPADPFAIEAIPASMDPSIPWAACGGGDAAGSVCASGDDLHTFAIASFSGDVTFATMCGSNLDTLSTRTRGVVNGANTFALSPATAELFVAGRFANGVAGLRWFRECDTGHVAGLFASTVVNTPNVFDTSEVRSVVFTDEGDQGFVTTSRPDAILRLEMQPAAEEGEDVPAPRYVDRLDLDGGPAEMVLLDERGEPKLYVVLSDEDAIAVVDVETMLVEDVINVGNLPFAMVADDTNRRRLYVSLFDDHAIGVIDIDPTSPTFRRMIGRIR